MTPLEILLVGLIWTVLVAAAFHHRGRQAQQKTDNRILSAIGRTTDGIHDIHRELLTRGAEAEVSGETEKELEHPVSEDEPVPVDYLVALKMAEDLKRQADFILSTLPLEQLRQELFNRVALIKALVGPWPK